MGYNGKAFVVTLGTRYAGGRYQGITALACEIQVRTILQDAWAIIGRQLVYKNEETTPERAQRVREIVVSRTELNASILYANENGEGKRTHFEGGDFVHAIALTATLKGYAVVAIANDLAPRLEAARDKVKKPMLKPLKVRKQKPPQKA